MEIKKNVKCLLRVVLFCFLCAFVAQQTIAKKRCRSVVRPLRLMTYNLHHCEGLDKKMDIRRIADIIRQNNPEVIAVQELDSFTRRCMVDELGELGVATRLFPTYAPTIDFQGGKYGIGILSKDVPLRVTRVPLPGKEPRMLLICEFRDYVFACTHLSLQASNQMQSLPIILEQARRYTKPFFIAGDWNVQPKNKYIQNFCQDFVLLNDTTVFTFSSDRPYECIDYIAKLKNGCCSKIGGAKSGKALKNCCKKTKSDSKDSKSCCPLLKSVSAKVIPETVASDHRPVVVDLQLPTFFCR